MPQKVYEIEVEGKVYEVEADSPQAAAAAASKFSRQALPLTPGPAPKQTPGILSRAVSNILPDVGNILQGFGSMLTSNPLVQTPEAAANRIAQDVMAGRTPGIVAPEFRAIPERYAEIAADPEEAFANAPVSTVLDVAAPVSLGRNAVRGIGRGLYNVGAKQAGVGVGKPRPIARADLSGGFENEIAMTEAGAQRGQDIIARAGADIRNVESEATLAGGRTNFLEVLKDINPELVKHTLNYLRRGDAVEHAVGQQGGNIRTLMSGRPLSTANAGDVTRHFQDLADSAFRASEGILSKGPATRARSDMLAQISTGAKNATEASIERVLGQEGLVAYRSAKALTQAVAPATKAAAVEPGGGLPPALRGLAGTGMSPRLRIADNMMPGPAGFTRAGLTLKALADMPGVKQTLGRPGTTRLLLAFQLAKEAGDVDAAEAIYEKLVSGSGGE